jgi:DNA-binding CsgD family transcriptional regulator/catechol 2,3-dioxygenase-like lactoylglutathione lyase family enzyme
MGSCTIRDRLSEASSTQDLLKSRRMSASGRVIPARDLYIKSMTKRGRPPHSDILTPAEWRIVEGVRHGLTNGELATKCDLTLDGVKFHVSNVLLKLGLKSRRELRQWSGVRADSALQISKGPEHWDDWTLGQVARLTRDLEATSNWLRNVVGLRQIMRFETAVFFDCGGIRLYLSVGDPSRNSLLYFRVGDILAEVERLRAAGVVITNAPHRIHIHEDGREEWMAFFSDPEGNPLGLMSEVSA